MIHSIVRIITKQEKHHEVLRILCSLAERTRALTGCINCFVYRDAQMEYAIMLDQRWSGMEQLKRHLCSDDYRNVLLSMEMASEPPDVRFETVSHVSGMEMIEEVRMGSLVHKTG
jgi:quinol monooxygenase YgiN